MLRIEGVVFITIDRLFFAVAIAGEVWSTYSVNRYMYSVLRS
jgi:hypothetical protein